MATSTWTDELLEDTVQTRLCAEMGLQLYDLVVFSLGGKLRLSGAALSYADKKRVTEVAGAVRGVRQVVNQIRVLPSEATSPITLQTPSA